MQRQIQRGIGSEIRTGIDIWDQLRDRLDNLVCLSASAEYNIDFGELDSSISLRFPDTCDCKIAVAPLIDQINLIEIKLFERDIDDKMPFVVIDLKEPDMMARRTVSILRELDAKEVDLVVLPELCLSNKIRQAITKELKSNILRNIKIIIAGSCHEWNGFEWRNTVYVYGPEGDILWQQNKMQANTLKDYEASQIPALRAISNCDFY